MQPLYRDSDNRVRFEQNALIRVLLSTGKLGLSELADLPNIAQGDWDQFYQLLGYSVDGYGELSLVSDHSKSEAARRAQQLFGHEPHPYVDPLIRALQTIPHITIKVTDVAPDKNGWVEVSRKGDDEELIEVIECSLKGFYGMSSIRETDDPLEGYGIGADEVFHTVEAVIERLNQIIAGKIRTVTHP